MHSPAGAECWRYLGIFKIFGNVYKSLLKSCQLNEKSYLLTKFATDFNTKSPIDEFGIKLVEFMNDKQLRNLDPDLFSQGWTRKET